MWSATPDAVVSSWDQAAAAAEEGAAIIHLSEGTYGSYDWDHPGVLLRNVPGEHARVDGSLVVVATDVTVGGVDINRFSARSGGDGATLLRSNLRDGVNVNGGGETLVATLREVHRPERTLVNDGDVIHVNEGGELVIEGSYIEGDDLEAEADGHVDTVQLVNGGQALTVVGSYLGRSHNATIIEQGAQRIHILDSFLGWAKDNDVPGGVGLSFEALDVEIRRSVSARLYWVHDADEVDLTEMTIEENRFVRLSDDADDGRIKFGTWGQWGDDAYPANQIVSADLVAEPSWIPPDWWDDLGIPPTEAS